ncbi:MAG: zinc dependent phospholipase C family protein [Lachnospiraceae bacterium]|nr:zinc dependent phospholipase C family protein [Lachnospiraceae bacterium]
MNIPSCIGLGYAIHYVEDYFTNPHNELFEGNIWDHIAYEHHLTEFIAGENTENEKTEEMIQNASELIRMLEKTYITYLEETEMIQNYNMESDDRMETDSLYMKLAVGNIMLGMAGILKRNKQFNDAALKEAFTIGAQHNIYY